MPNIDEAIESFLQSNAHVWSPATSQTYGSALRRFLTYLEQVERPRRDSPTLSTQDLAGDLDIFLRYADYLATLPCTDSPSGGDDSQGLSELTYRLYLTALSEFVNHLFMVDDLDVSATEVQQLLARLRAAKHPSLKATTLRPKRIRHAPRADLIDRLIRLAKIEFPDASTPERDQRYAELRRLRNTALLETLRSTGARISEAVGLDRGDVAVDRSAVIRPQVAKGGKERVVFFDGRSWRALRVYLTQTGPASSTDPVFLQHGRRAGDARKRLGAAGAQAEIRRLRRRLVEELREELVRLLMPGCSDESVAQWLGEIEQAASQGDWFAPLAEVQQMRSDLADPVDELRAQIEEARRITAHSFRHALGSLLLEETGDLAAVQDILGHADPRTTREYAKLSDARLRKLHEDVMEDSGRETAA